jgi:HSF-type DNA-binding
MIHGVLMLPLNLHWFSGRTSSPPVLGRIIVHDRVEVEGKVLPRYFNHSSFASLRRQLNYFSFIRLGKGRQRESTYINENVVELDDILHLKRRSASGQLVQPAPPKQELVSGISTVYDRDISHEKLENKAHIRTCSMDNSEASLEQPHKRRRHSAPTTVSPRSTSPVESYSMSEEDESSHVALDLTLPESQRDEDFMMGCKNLLCLSSKRWD